MANKRFLNEDFNFSRYVFFKSRMNKWPECMPHVGEQAQEQLNHVKSALIAQPQTRYETETDKHLGNIEHYLSFLESTIANLRANEIDFLMEQYKNFPEGSELRKLFLDMSKNPKEIPYDKIMDAFNEILQYDTRFEESMEEQKDLMTTTQDTLKGLAKDELDRLDQLQEEKYRYYVGELFNKMSAADVDTSKYKQNLTNRLAQKANEVLKGLSSNGEVIGVITQGFNEQGMVDENAIRDAVLNTIMSTIIDIKNSDKDSSQLIDIIQSKLTTNLENTLDDISDDEFSNALTPIFKSVEEVALTVGGKSIGNYLLELNTESIENLREHYGDEMVERIFELKKKQEKNEIKPNELKEQRKALGKDMREAIKERARKIAGDQKFKKMTQDEFTEQFGNAQDFLTSGKLKGGLAGALKSIKVTHSTIAEILTAGEGKQKLEGALNANLPGVSITFKADVIINTGAISVSSEDFDGIDVDTAINNVIKNNCKDFFLRYKAGGGGSTKISVAKQAYKETLAKMKQELDDQLILVRGLTKDSEEYKKAIEEFQKTFSVSISIKDYDVYGNIFGFHGGSLGSKKVPEKVLENVYAMYETGGLSTVDVEALLFAVLNCGDAMIGSELRPLLEHYILGGAALMMFDDSFTAIEGYFDKAAGEFTGQKTVNIYRLNTKYVPASYVLDGILKSLRSYYNDLKEESKLQYGKVTINNPFTAQNMPRKGDPWQNMETMSQKALNGINISFSFMGGLLDTINKGPDTEQ